MALNKWIIRKATKKDFVQALELVHESVYVELSSRVVRHMMESSGQRTGF